MEILNFIFRIGVILAVYNFLWWLIMLGFNLLRGRSRKQLFEIYFIKIIRYGFLADVIFLFAIQQSDGMLLLNEYLIAGLILSIYFLGKIQNYQTKQFIFSVRGTTNVNDMNGFFNKMKPAFDLRYEILVVVLSLLLYVGFYFYSSFADNAIANWFLRNILEMEKAPVFGFIFKVVGFFFLLSVIFKITNGFITMLSGGRLKQYDKDRRDEDDFFDDFTEIE